MRDRRVQIKLLGQVPCIHVGGHLDGTAGVFDSTKDKRCVVLEDLNVDEPPLKDGRRHVTCMVQMYAPGDPPEFIDGLLILRLAGQIESCNHDLH